MSNLLVRVLLASAIALICSFPAAAQDVAEERVVVPWAPLNGVYEQTESGLTGFFAELAQEIGRRAGFEVDFRRYPTYPAALAAQAEGETDMLAGVIDLPIMRGRVLLSEPVAETAVYLFVLGEARADTNLDSMAGRRVGIVRDAAGSDLADLRGRAEVVTFDTVSSAFAALLVGQVDGVVTLHKAAVDFLRKARLDYRIRIAGEPLRSEPHYIALSPDRADLMPRINRAIDDMRADGTLSDLLQWWNMIPPEPAPGVLTVGVTHFPPYQVVNADGTFTGYGVETLRGLASRAGLTLRYKGITVEEWARGPGPGRYDLLPPISVTNEKRQTMDFSIPIQQSPYAIFVRYGEGDDVQGLDDLEGLRVGVRENNYAAQLARDHGGLMLSTYPDESGLFEGLLSEEVDAVLYASVPAREILSRGGLSGDVREIMPPFDVSQRAVALRLGLPEVRERLNAAIPGYLSSEEFIALRDRWMGDPVFWTPARIRLAGGIGIALAVLIPLAFLVQAKRAQHRLQTQADDLRRVSVRLRAILNATRAAIVGLRRDGRVAFANPGAVGMLGLNGDAWPADWPGELTFVGADNDLPLQSSADPVQRARAGAEIVSERAVLRTGESDPRRFVRISSSPVEAPAQSDLSTVLVIEDVTEQEKVRQQAERAGRLDALGQLTGGVAHDFNNILATIQYAAQLASMSADETQKAFLEKALASVERGSLLTGRLLAFAKRQPGAPEAVSVTRVLRELRDLAGPLLETSVTLETEFPEPDLWVVCDSSQLENALLNLVLNSRDAILGAADSGRIVVRACATAPDAGGFDRVEISVVDDGPGMSPEVRIRATDPFFTTKGSDGGTGLGLSMVYGFVEQSDGEMDILSTPDHGATVILRLPGGDMPDGSEQTYSEQVERGSGECVLIVEDESDLLFLTSELVKSLGYRVLTAATGRAALDLVDADPDCFDILLTDVVMPGGIGGFDLVRRIRDVRPDVAIVYMSGYTGITRENMGNVSAPLVRKPCRPAELSRVLRRALRSAQHKSLP
ncbi:transporter substrate-binding domain-containing protein [Sagittula stellata]|uniref:histidine kinase n=1 Tax=Sagittula stellata (strain ATCC 700073 / DSM 11524 / E-37) TaxID=388399 RepID=A3K8Q7_SAGS3|nr:transporter substrate-binding domain-containing protein [Sagittula stellata]EBA06495.1 sensor histidine kinase with a PAC motif and a response regulator receiver domain [Sagittula stellata E-37]